MREAHQWIDDKSIQSGILKMRRQKSRNLIKNSDVLTIMAVGGCSQIGNGLKSVLEKNFLSPPTLANVYSKIVIVADRDEAGSELSMIQTLKQILNGYNVTHTSSISNNVWLQCSMHNQIEWISIFLFYY